MNKLISKCLGLAWILFSSSLMLSEFGSSIVRWYVAYSPLFSYTLAMKSTQPEMFAVFHQLNIVFPLFIVLSVSILSVAIIKIGNSTVIKLIHKGTNTSCGS